MVKKADIERAPLSLYRKYRPGGFAEVRGQAPLVAVLEAAIAQKKIAHAYLFAGGRGTGKTSMARILAHALNTSEQDIYEMDAASNRGIDEIRALREGVSTLPFNSPYKFYIIDEAHALTKDAWGALLKTLEEPPAHVVFVLATTELDRVPETIVSRCQVFNFKKPTHEVLKTLVLDIVKKEGASMTPQAAELVALMGDGSFRDTLGILQKVLTVSLAGQASDTRSTGSGQAKLTEDEVAAVVGAPSSQLVNAFLEALALHQAGEAIALLTQAGEAGIEPSVFALLVISKVRAVLLLRFAGAMEKNIKEQFGEDDLAYLKELAGAKGAAINAEVLAHLIGALVQMQRAPIPQIPLELALYKLFG